MMKNWTNKCLLVLCVCVGLLAGSCARDEQEPHPTPEVEMTVRGVASAMAQSSAIDNQIATLRLIIFDDEGALIYNKKQANANPFTLRIEGGSMRVIMVANEVVDWQLDKIISSEELKLKSTYVERPTTLPMYADQTCIVTPTTRTFTIPLKRIFAKVTVNMSCDFATYKTTFDLWAISIKMVAPKAYMIPRIYVNEGISSTYGNFLAGDIITTPTSVRTKEGGLDFYIAEKWVNTTAEYAYVQIAGYAGTDPKKLLLYDVVVGDGAAKMYGANPVPLSSLSAADLSLMRNTHITLTISLVKDKNKGALCVRMDR
ncbi:MAG: hypothetical protein RSB29_04995 [Alistipes sp.]